MMTAPYRPAHTRPGPDATSPAPGPLRVRTSRHGEDRHIPVMADRIGDLLAPALAGPRPVIVDGTLGLAGHTLTLLAAHPHAHVIGIDRDTEALRRATERVAEAGFADRFTPVHAIYDAMYAEVTRTLEGLDLPPHADAVLLDLGVSSMQLDRPERGFAYAADAPLDMRMDQSAGITAAQVLADYSAADLARILRQYGEERFAQRIAQAIVSRRGEAPIETSADLVEIIRSAIPAAARHASGHPAKRTFQALRIEVNDELGALTRAMPAALRLLRVGGRIAVLTYHSLEDRIVKHAIAPLTVSTTPPGLPVELPGHGPTFRWITRGGERPSEAESHTNPRSSSARLRAAERIAS